jgi:hypothetical protein
MTLITKVGGAESNSFVTLLEADDLIEYLPDDRADWYELTDAQKEYRLILGAAMMSNLPLKGRKAYRNQMLAFPRTGQGNMKIIPDEVKETQVFIAYSVIHRGLVNRPDLDETEGDRVTQVSLGGLLTVSFASSISAKSSSLDQVIMSAQFPAYVRMSKWLLQIRMRMMADEDDITLSTTTTTTTT